MSIDWEDLRYVLEVRRAGNLSQAAKTLGVAHSTVGRRLARIETELGALIFARTPEGYAPTSAGEELCRCAEQMDDLALAATARVMGRDLALSGRLRVSTLDFVFALFGSAFESFVPRYPNVALTITTNMAPVSLTRREADIVLRLTNSPPPGLVGRRIAELEFAVFGAPALVATHGESELLADYPWLGFDEHLHEDVGWHEAWLKAEAPGATIVLRTDDNAMLQRQLVRDGVGVFFFPRLEGEALGLRQIGPVRDRRGLWLLTLPELRTTARVRAFLDHMAEHVPRALART